MIVYKTIAPEEVEAFWEMLCRLDRETNAMMYEPGERAERTSLSALREDIQSNVLEGEDFLELALKDGEIVGYLRAERGQFNRISHTAYVVTGVLKAARGQGIGTALFQHLDRWAREKGILRLELTVECPNEAARHLYEKSGFEVEGLRKKAMSVDGTLVDEYYMAKIF